MGPPRSAKPCHANSSAIATPTPASSFARPLQHPDARTAGCKVRGACSSNRSLPEIDRGRIPSADEDADALANCRLVGARQQRREGRNPARLRNNPQCLPERIL
jgi:hypothetical protein